MLHLKWFHKYYTSTKQIREHC